MNYEETLSTLKAIQASYAPVPFLANPETEPRFVIDSDTREIIIPDEFKFLAVKMDHMSEKIYFEIPRYFDDEDLVTKICVVQYINTNGDVPIEAIVAAVDVDTESEAGKIIFRWDVDNYLTRYAGVVSFAVRFYTISDDNRFTYSWNTLPATLPVLDTLDNTNDTVSQNYPTELVQWQFRMSELDRTISEKIEEATTSIDVDVKSAQTARKGAEDAEARVNTIVAGNEAYTKQQSHDRFALALHGTAYPEASITIYPDAESNVAVTAHGFTVQEGEGDASPVNQRPIANGGMKLVEVIFTGEEYWYQRLDAEKHNGYLETPITKPGNVSTHYAVSNVANFQYAWAGNGVFCDDKRIRFGAAFGSKYTVENWKAMLAARYAAGDPVMAWYQPASDTDATGLYVPLVGTGSGATGQCVKITKPLCEGDVVITRIMSGCDKKVVLDGGVADGLTYTDGGNGGANKRMRHLQVSLPDMVTYSAGGAAYSNRLPQISNWNSEIDCLYPANGFLMVIIEADSYSAAKDVLSQNPLPVWYKSSAYVKASDKPVSMEMHAKWLYTFTGKEGGTLQTQSSGVKRLGLSVKGPQCKSNVGPEITCTHAKGGPTSDTADRIQSGTNNAMYLTLSTFQGEDATSESANQYLADQLASGTPVIAVYPLTKNVTYAHDPVDFIASPDEEGTWVITGEADGTVSAEYNKNITKALEDILTRVSALELHALGG